MTPVAAASLLAVACPACGARYDVPLAKLGPKGRSLKCAQCQHVWRIMPPAAAPESAPAESIAPEPASVPAASPAAPPASPLIVPPGTVAAEPASSAVTPTAPETTPTVPDNDAVESSLTAPSLADLAQPGWQRWGRAWLAEYVLGEQRYFTLALLLTGGGVIAGGLALWHQLQPPAPPANPWALQGPPMVAAAPILQPLAPPEGLLLQQLSPTLWETSASRVLQVQGVVANSSATVLALPPLRAALVDEAGALQDFQLVTLPSTTLPPGLEIPFSVSFSNPLGSGWQLDWLGAVSATMSGPSAAVTAVTPTEGGPEAPRSGEPG